MRKKKERHRAGYGAVWAGEMVGEIALGQVSYVLDARRALER